MRIRSERWLIPLAEQLREEQLGQLRERLAEQQRELQEEYLGRSDEAFREENRDRWEDILKDYLGSLEPHQSRALDRMVASLERTDSLWLRERERWLAVFDTVLARGPGWQDLLRELLSRDLIDSPDYQAVYERNRERAIAMLVSVLQRSSDDQRQHLVRELADLRRSLSQAAG